MRNVALALCAAPLMATFLPPAAAQQSTTVAEAPSPKEGDRWRSRRIDGWTKNEVAVIDSVLVEVQPQRFIFRTTAPTGETVTRHFNRDLNPCRSMTNSSEIVCSGPLKFPLKVGDRTAIEKLPWTNGEGYFSETCEVKSFEQVKVPAGTFDAFRVECSGTWTRVFGGSFTGRIEETFFYAPKANGFVMWTFTDYRANGQIFNKFVSELTEYMPKP